MVSVGFQVLCKYTSFIGVIKNKEKSEGELQKVVMPTISAQAYQEDIYNYNIRSLGLPPGGFRGGRGGRMAMNGVATFAMKGAVRSRMAAAPDMRKMKK